MRGERSEFYIFMQSQGEKRCVSSETFYFILKSADACHYHVISFVIQEWVYKFGQTIQPIIS